MDIPVIISTLPPEESVIAATGMGICLIAGGGALFSAIMIAILNKETGDKSGAHGAMLAAVLIAVVSGLGLWYSTGETSEHQRQVIAFNEQILEQRNAQLKTLEVAYGLDDLEADGEFKPLCNDLTRADKYPATWTDGNGSLVISSTTEDQCHVELFDSAGNRLEPAHH